MPKTFDEYFNHNNGKLESEKTKLQQIQLSLQTCKYTLENTRNPREIANVIKRKEKLKKQITNSEEIIAHLEFLAGNPDELVKNYLRSLPINRKTLYLEDILERHSLTKIPDDISRFPGLQVLHLSFNRCLSSGFERLPTTLKRLHCHKTNIPNEDTAWILRLVNLETLQLSRNDLICDLPDDLTSLTKLKHLYIDELNLRSLPTLPPTIKTLSAPINELSRYFTKSFYNNEIKRLIPNTGPQHYYIDDFTSKSEATHIIHHINRTNRFDKIREELLEKGGRIVMNPNRITRLLDQCEIDLDSDWSDIFEFQKRREYAYPYSRDIRIINFQQYYSHIERVSGLLNHLYYE